MTANTNSVCIISTVHPPHDQRIFHKQAKSLLDCGWDVSFVVHNNQDEVREGISIKGLGEANSRPERWMHLRRAYRRSIDTPADVYHLHDPELLPLGYILKKRTDAGVIFDMHEDFVGNKIAEGHREWIPPIARSTVSRILPTIFSLFMSRIDAVVTTTSSMANRVAELGANHVELVRNFPKITRQCVNKEVIQKDHQYQLVYVGRLTEERGIMRMLCTLRRLQNENDIGLWLLGTFVDDEEKSRAIKYINQNDLNVRQFGYVEYNKIFPILNAADVGFALVDSTLNEHNISTKIFEYMYTETPYVGTDAGTIRAYTSKDIGILVPEDNIKSATNAIRCLLKDPDRLQRMGESGQKKVETTYNWDVEFAKLSDLYDNITGGTV